jgi:glycosyltransferase involved in cell wall biosynthesis
MRHTFCTGFGIVLANLAHELSQWFRVIYFMRFTRESEFDPETSIYEHDSYEMVKCQGGVWDDELLVRALKHYDAIDYVFTEDDWFSSQGFIHACNFWNKPFYLHSPIDSLPVEQEAFRDVFSMSDAIFIPNRSYLQYHGRQRPNTSAHRRAIERAGDTLDSIYLPHAARSNIFKPLDVKRPEEFCFVWSGRDEPRKALGRFILAFEQVHEQAKGDVCAWVRTDWNVDPARRTKLYITRKKLPIYMDQMEDNPHHEQALLYNRGDVYVNTAKAGGFEMGIVEAMSCEKPTICADHTFMNEHTIDGETGFLIPVGGRHWREPAMVKSHYGSWWGNINIDMLAEKMLQMYNYPEKTKRMGQLARLHSIDRYDWTRTGKTLRDAIRNG